jgi:signal transduction histidine kinase
LIEEKVDIAEIVNESVRIMSGKIRSKGIHVVVAIEPEIPFVWGDKRKPASYSQAIFRWA